MKEAIKIQKQALPDTTLEKLASLLMDASAPLQARRNSCWALAYAAENGQILSVSIINNLLEISNKQELGEICETSSKAVKHSLLNDKQLQANSSIIDLLEAGLKHSNMSVRDNIIVSLGYVARNGVEISSSVIHTIEDNLVCNQDIESSIEALHSVLGVNNKIDLKIKTAKALLNIGVNSNYSLKLQKQSLECLVQLSHNGKAFSCEITKDLSLVLESQYLEFRKFGLEIIEHYLKSNGCNSLLPNNLIDSLGHILETDTLPVLNILKQVSQIQKLSDQALSSLSNTLISVDSDLVRDKALAILETQNNKFGLKTNIKHFVKIEEETRVLISDTNF